MKYYIDITLLPGADIAINFLWEKVYQQLHIALVNLKDSQQKVAVGVAFPEYDDKEHKLGTILRLFSEAPEPLEQLSIKKTLSTLSEYTHVTRVKPVPETVTGHALFKRIQTKSSTSRLARRKAKRENISYDEAWGRIAERPTQTTNALYIQMKSLSSGCSFPLFIHKQQVDQTHQGKFSTYGLSATTTVPEF